MWSRFKPGFRFKAIDWPVELGYFVGTFGLLYVVNQRYYRLTFVEGISMLPTFRNHGDVLLINRSDGRYKRYEKGDIVVAFPKDEDHLVVKRVRGVGGDTIPVARHRFGQRWLEEVDVPEDHVWLSGDNALVSVDSSNYGPVPSDRIVGRVCFQLWPPTKFGPCKRTLEHQERHESFVLERYS